jgi:hypothetical protein
MFPLCIHQTQYPLPIAAGFAALAPILLPGPVVPSNGLPQVGVLCFGNTAAGAPRLVVSCNSSNWNRFPAMFNWMRNARQSNANMPPAYRITVQDLSNRLVNMGGHVNAMPVPPAQDLQLAWNNAVTPGGHDAALATTWTTIYNTTLLAPASRTFFHVPAGFEALPFNTRNMAPRCRCCRCGVIFLFRMNAAEPQIYNAGPYNDRLSCAEVTAYQKCLRYGI